MDDRLDTLRLELLQQLRGARGGTGHQVIARELKAFGVTHVYGIAGTPVDETLAACGSLGMRVIATRHQQAAVLASAAHNFIAGTLRSAVVVSAGPGVTNCTTGVTVARSNGWPLLVIGGRRDVAMDAAGGFQCLDGAELFSSITRGSRLVESTGQLSQVLQLLRHVSLQGERGPCYLDVTEHALQSIEPVTLPERPTSTAARLPTVDEEVIDLLRASRRPVVVLGHSLRFDDDYVIVRELIERFSLPFVATPMARGFLPDDHDLCASEAKSQVLNAADLVLLLGARLDWMTRFSAEIDPGAWVLRSGEGTDAVVRDRAGSIDLGLSPGVFVRQLVMTSGATRLFDNVEPGWQDRVKVVRRSLERARQEAISDGAVPLAPARVMHVVSDSIPADCRTIFDGNFSMAWAQAMLDVNAPLRRLTAGANGCMGVGVPYAIASFMADPSTPVLAICGDFALGVSLQDLETLVRHDVTAVILLMNNGGSGGKLRTAQYWPEGGQDRVCEFTPGVRHDLIMQAFGGAGEAVQTEDQLRAALTRAFSRNGPTLIDVAVRDDIGLPAFKVDFPPSTTG